MFLFLVAKLDFMFIKTPLVFSLISDLFSVALPSGIMFLLKTFFMICQVFLIFDLLAANKSE